tara:strand:- start:4457 stop:5728 length:1272 start_codon:yes stop_codon:yes gene_type:complete
MRNATRARRVFAMDEWFALVERRVREAGDSEQREQLEQLEHVRQQVDLCLQYDATCVKLHGFARTVRTRGDLLVPLRFPVRPTARNRQSIAEGMLRSYTHFVQELGALSLTTNAHRLEYVRHDPDAPLVQQLAGVLALESGRVLDRAASAQEAVGVCVRFVEARRLDLVRGECATLQEVRRACEVVLGLMQLFCKRHMALKRAATRPDVVVASRAWLRTAARHGSGLSHAVHVLCRRRRMAPFFDAHAWLTRQYADFSDDEALEIWHTLVGAHAAFTQFVAWEIRRIEWLCATNAANSCWDGVVLTSSQSEQGGAHDEEVAWATGGALVHAPAHMGTFATLERVRLVGEVQTAPYSCYMGTVRVTNVLLELLRTNRLVLDKIGMEYANRIAASDYAKYECARRRIVEETLKPFGETVGVNYGA